MSRSSLLWATCLICAGLTALAQERPTRRVLGSERLQVFYWPRHEELARLALREGDDALRRLAGLLDTEPDERVEVHIVRSQAEFDELTGIDNKPWVLGRAFLPGVPDVPYRVVVKPMGKQRLPALLTHELAHVMLDVAMDDAADRIPRWLHEGIAQYAEGELSRGDRQVIGSAALSDELLTIDELEGAFAGDREQVALAYAQSRTLVAYLSDQNPAEGISGLLDQLRRGREIRLALGLAFGRPVPEMEEEWLDGLRREYPGALLPPTSEILIGAGFVVSFLLAVVVMRRRSAAIRRRMEAGEEARSGEGLLPAQAGDEVREPARTEADADEAHGELVD